MTAKIIAAVIQDILRGRVVLVYALSLSAASFGLFQLAGDAAKGLASLLSLVLLVVPLFSLVYGSIHFYNSYEFIELLAAQPIRRRAILLGQFFGVAISLSLALLAGFGLPVALYAPNATGVSLMTAGLALTLSFVAIAFLSAVSTRDKTRGIGIALFAWFYFALLHGGLMLFVLFAFEEYPLEQAAIALIALNPVDLARVLVLLQMDVSALMGYTGAMMQAFFGTTAGMGFAGAVLALWAAGPLALALWIFNRKDL